MFEIAHRAMPSAPSPIAPRVGGANDESVKPVSARTVPARRAGRPQRSATNVDGSFSACGRGRVDIIFHAGALA